MSNIKMKMSRQSEYFLIRAKQKFPVLSLIKFSPGTSYGEGRMVRLKREKNLYTFEVWFDLTIDKDRCFEIKNLVKRVVLYVEYPSHLDNFLIKSLAGPCTKSNGSRETSRMDELKVKNDLAEMNKIRGFLKKNLKELNISDKDYYKIEVSLLEMCINIIRYAYPQDKGDVFLKTWKREGKIFLEIKDNGIPFDPRKAKKPDIRDIIKSGKKGGFGILLSRKLMDGFDYRRENNQNILTMYKKIKEAQASD